MALDFMNANFMGGQGGSFEPQRTNQMKLIITGLDGQASSRDDVIQLAINSFPLPKVSLGVIEVGYMNEKRKFAGNPTYGAIQLKFVDYVDKDVAGILWRWHQLSHDPVTGKGGMAAIYKKTAYVQMFSPDGQIQRDYRLEGCWLSDFDHGDCEQEGEESIKITVQMEIDKFYPVFAGISP